MKTSPTVDTTIAIFQDRKQTNLPCFCTYEQSDCGKDRAGEVAAGEGTSWSKLRGRLYAEIPGNERKL
jgi:hypothetical protein